MSEAASHNPSGDTGIVKWLTVVAGLIAFMIVLGGVTRLAESDYDGCLELCDRILEQEPDIEEIWKLRGDTERLAGREPFESYERALQVRRTYFEALHSAAEAHLLRGNVVRLHPHAVVLGHVDGQRSPAATELEHFLAGLEGELAAHVIQLRELCLGQRGVWRGVVGAGVDHALVEPQGVEVVTEIVVAVDVLARLLAGVQPWRARHAVP